MTLQNRVTPLGEIVADPHRGMFTGNRGIIHDPATKTLLGKRWSTPAWLTCVCEFRGRRRKALKFRAAWEEGNGVADVLARDVDAVLHRERLAGRRKRLHALPKSLEKLPDGAMVASGEASYLIADGKALQWSPGGYRAPSEPVRDAMLLTPPSTVRAFGAGYRPVLHASAVK